MQVPHRHRVFGALELSLLLAVLLGKSIFVLSVVGAAAGVAA